MNELVDEHFDSLRVVAEHRRGRLQARDVAVVVGTEHVDRAVEPALELVPDVCDVGCEIQIRAVGRAHQRTVLVVAVRTRSRPQRPFRFVCVELRQDRRNLVLELRLPAPRVDRDPKRLDLPADLLEHRVHRVALVPRDLVHVVADVALGRRFIPTASRLHRLAEELDLPAGVVEVVLLVDLVTRESQQPRYRVSVRAVARRTDRQRRNGVRRDELHLHACVRNRESAAVLLVDLGERLREPVSRDPDVDEAGACDLGALDLREADHALGELGGDVAWSMVLGRRAAQRDVRRVVAVRRIARPFELDRGTGELRDLFGEPRDRVTGQRLASVRTDPRARESPPTYRRRRAHLPRRESSPASGGCRSFRPRVAAPR